MSGSAVRSEGRRGLLLVHQFPLASVTGVTAMLGELLRLLGLEHPDVPVAYASYDEHASPAALRAALEGRYAEAACVVAFNAHIEVAADKSAALFAGCRALGIPSWVYVHDYWPHHRPYLQALVVEHGALVLASTPFLRESLARDGFDAPVLPVGVRLPDRAPDVPIHHGSKLVASAGRLVPRKRFSDLVRAFAAARLADHARLYLRVLPSHVYRVEEDDALFAALEAEARRLGLGDSVTLDRRARETHDYAPYDVYVCASEYEGFSMTVIEAAYHACPPIMSDIAPHRVIARALFGDAAPDHLYPTGDHAALVAIKQSGRTSAILNP